MLIWQTLKKIKVKFVLKWLKVQFFKPVQSIESFWNVCNPQETCLQLN